MHCCWCRFCWNVIVLNKIKNFTVNAIRMETFKIFVISRTPTNPSYLKVFGRSTFLALFFLTTTSSSSSFALLLLRLKMSNAELDAFMPFPLTLLLKLYSELDGFIFASKNLAGRNFQSKLGGKPCSAIRGASGTTIRRERSKSSLFLFFL